MIKLYLLVVTHHMRVTSLMSDMTLRDLATEMRQYTRGNADSSTIYIVAEQGLAPGCRKRRHDTFPEYSVNQTDVQNRATSISAAFPTCYPRELASIHRTATWVRLICSTTYTAVSLTQVRRNARPMCCRIPLRTWGTRCAPSLRLSTFRINREGGLLGGFPPVGLREAAPA